MEPTIAAGEAGVVKPFKNSGSETTRGQVVAYRSERHSGIIIPSRVVALAGQSVEIRDGELLVDNARVPEPYLDPRRAERDYSRTVAKTPVPEGAAYLLGDFRDMSEDSRTIGAVSLRSIVGQVVLAIPLKPDSNSRKVR
jgi:signal peptidase I